jgi:hypothetical protein
MSTYKPREFWELPHVPSIAAGGTHDDLPVIPPLPKGSPKGPHDPVAHFGECKPAEWDGFGPPKDNVRVECWHCGRKYNSGELRLMYRPRMQGALVDAVGNGLSKLSPLWWCKHDDCDGAGFGHDIHPVTEKRSKRRSVQ